MSSKRKRADDLPENPLAGLPLTGALSKQVTDTTVSNQQPAKEGGPIKRKKATSLGALIETGVIKDGAVLRYMKGTGLSYSGKLMAVGRARMDGVEVHGNAQLLGMSGFEAYANSTAHRPAQFTFTSSGQSLQTLQQQHAGEGGGAARKPPGKWGMTAEGRATHYPVPQPVSEANDEVCRVCWQGGDLLCCEACPAVMHARCAGLADVPCGDWHCPSCTCAACGHPALQPEADSTPPQATLVEPPTGSEAPVWRGPLSGDKSEAAITMDAYAFDSIWPREGALAARSQLQAQAQAERAAEAVAAAAAAAQQQAEAGQERARPPSARLAQRATAADADPMTPVKADPAQAESVQVMEDIHRSSVADFSHLSAPVSHVRQPQQGLTELPAASAVAAAPAAAAAQASSAAAAAPEVAQSPRRSLRSPQSFQAADAPPAVEAPQDGAWTGRLHQTAQNAQSRQEVVSFLDDMFPPTNSAAKSRLLREAFAVACPAQPYKSRVEAIKHMAESLWQSRGDAKADSAAPPPAQGAERKRRRGAGALMSAALAAELSNNAELDGPAHAGPARFLQVDGCDDPSSADEGAQPQQVSSAAAATHVEPAQPSAGPWDSGITLSHAVQSSAAPVAAVQPPQHALGGPLQPGEPAGAAAAQLQSSMPAYLLGGQQPSEHPLGPPQVPSAEALTAQLQQEIGSLSRVLGPAEAMRQALQRQMAAVQQGNAALHQLRSGPSAVLQATLPPMAASAQAQAHPVPNTALMGADTQPQVASAPAPALPAWASLAALAPAMRGPSAAISAHRQQHTQPCSMPSQAQPTPMPAQVQHLGVTKSPAAQALACKSALAMPQSARPLNDLPGGAAPKVPGVATQRPLSAGFDSAQEAAAAFGRPTARTGQPPSGAQAALVSCAGCGMRMHLGCLPGDVQAQAKEGRWFHSSECSAADSHMARLAASGLMPVEGVIATPMAPAFAWQIIRGAAVSSPKDCRGHAPSYGEGAREALRGTLHALRHLFHEALGPLLDSRTGRDLLPALLQGKALSRHCLDFSGFHSAVLWLGPSIAAAGLFRVLGPDVAELPALAVRPELQGNGLGRLLLALLESALLEAGVKLLAMPALVPFPSSSPKQAALENGQPGTLGTAGGPELIPTWAKSMQYGQATCAQLARMSALPVLHFAGAQFAVKALSASTCLKVQVPSELHLCEDLNEQEYCRARLLQPAGLAAYAAQRAHIQTQAPVAAKEEPEEAAQPAAGAAPGRIEGASGVVKSEPGDGAVIGKVGRPAVGTLGRVKVPKGGFVK